MGRSRRPARSSGPSFLTAVGNGCRALSLAAAVFCGACLILGCSGHEQERKELAEANRRWDAGQKADAAAMYRHLLTRSAVVDSSQEPVVYLRLIEFDLEHGDVESARGLTERALDRGLDLRPDRTEAVKLLVDVRADRERRATEERDAEARRLEEERKNAPRLSIKIDDVRFVPFRTATGLDTRMVCIDWTNTGNRPVRAVSADIVCLDEDGREVYAPRDYYIYAVVFNNLPGIGPGEKYVEPSDEGHILPPFGNEQIVRVRVKIVRLEERVPEYAPTPEPQPLPKPEPPPAPKPEPKPEPPPVEVKKPEPVVPVKKSEPVRTGTIKPPNQGIVLLGQTKLVLSGATKSPDLMTKWLKDGSVISVNMPTEVELVRRDGVYWEVKLVTKTWYVEAEYVREHK